MEKNPTIVIKRILIKNYKELHNISENKGIPFPLFMRQTLNQVVERFPEHLKIKNENEETKNVVVSEISQKTFNELINICSNLNCSMSDLLKIETKKIADMQPANLKQEPLEY